MDVWIPLSIPVDLCPILLSNYSEICRNKQLYLQLSYGSCQLEFYLEIRGLWDRTRLTREELTKVLG